MIYYHRFAVKPPRQTARRTQERVIRLFEKGLGYEYLGSWQDREQNGNIEIEVLSRWLEKTASIGEGRSLYDANKEVYELLRYGVKVKEEAGAPSTTVWLVDWQNPERNHFAISEEVTIEGRHTKRPDIVIYLNGIAIGVLELKRSTVAVSEGIRQWGNGDRRIMLPETNWWNLLG